MCVAFFRYYENWFTRERVVGRSLQYVGVRTLDVYLLHYFFLPHLPAVGAWFKATPITSPSKEPPLSSSPFSS